MKTIISAVQTWTKGKIKDSIKNSVADWNENDSSKDSYVKNRTHWEEVITKDVELISEATIEPELDENSGYYFFSGVFSTELVIGQKYTVIFDGVTYKDLICFDDEGYAMIGAPYGNFSEYNFCMWTWFNDDGGLMLDLCTDLEGAHTISLSTIEAQTIIHKLDPKYLNLPTNIATTDDVQGAIDIANEAYQVADNAQTHSEGVATDLVAETTAREEADATKMDATNPVGTGSFSMNRKTGSVVGNYSCALGRELIVMHSSQSAFGQFNKVDNTNVSVEFVDGESKALKAVATGSVPYVMSLDLISYDINTGTYMLTDPATATFASLPAEAYFIGASKTTGDHLWKCTSNTLYGATGNRNINYVVVNANLIVNGIGTFLHSIGNGTSDTARSNAHTLDWDGNAWYAGTVYVGGTSQDDASEVALKSDLDNIDLSAYATTEQVDALSGLVGDTAISTQIENATEFPLVTAATEDGIAYTATVSQITSLTAGAKFIMIPGSVSKSTTPTLDVNGLGAKNLRRKLSNSSTVVPGYSAAWLSAGKPYIVMYDGTNWVVEGQNKPVAADLYGTVASATKATQDASGNVIVDTYATKTELTTVDDKWAGCWISFTDEDGNATTEPYIHWYEE